MAEQTLTPAIEPKEEVQATEAEVMPDIESPIVDEDDDSGDLVTDYSVYATGEKQDVAVETIGETEEGDLVNEPELIAMSDAKPQPTSIIEGATTNEGTVLAALNTTVLSMLYDDKNPVDVFTDTIKNPVQASQSLAMAIKEQTKQDDPFIDGIKVFASNLSKAATFQQSNAIIDRAYDDSFKNEAFMSTMNKVLGMGLPVARDLSLMMATGGISGTAAIGTMFATGAMEAYERWKFAKSMDPENKNIHPLTYAVTEGIASSIIFNRAGQAAISKLSNRLSPKVADMFAGAFSSGVENTLYQNTQNRLYEYAGYSTEGINASTVGIAAILGGYMNINQNRNVAMIPEVVDELATRSGGSMALEIYQTHADLGQPRDNRHTMPNDPKKISDAEIEAQRWKIVNSTKEVYSDIKKLQDIPAFENYNYYNRESKINIGKSLKDVTKETMSFIHNQTADTLTNLVTKKVEAEATAKGEIVTTSKYQEISQIKKDPEVFKQNVAEYVMSDGVNGAFGKLQELNIKDIAVENAVMMKIREIKKRNPADYNNDMAVKEISKTMNSAIEGASRAKVLVDMVAEINSVARIGGKPVDLVDYINNKAFVRRNKKNLEPFRRQSKYAPTLFPRPSKFSNIDDWRNAVRSSEWEMPDAMGMPNKILDENMKVKIDEFFNSDKVSKIYQYYGSDDKAFTERMRSALQSEVYGERMLGVKRKFTADDETTLLPSQNLENIGAWKSDLESSTFSNPDIKPVVDRFLTSQKFQDISTDPKYKDPKDALKALNKELKKEIDKLKYDEKLYQYDGLMTHEEFKVVAGELYGTLNRAVRNDITNSKLADSKDISENLADVAHKSEGFSWFSNQHVSLNKATHFAPNPFVQKAMIETTNLLKSGSKLKYVLNAKREKFFAEILKPENQNRLADVRTYLDILDNAKLNGQDIKMKTFVKNGRKMAIIADDNGRPLVDMETASLAHRIANYMSEMNYLVEVSRNRYPVDITGRARKIDFDSISDEWKGNTYFPRSPNDNFKKTLMDELEAKGKDTTGMEIETTIYTNRNKERQADSRLLDYNNRVSPLEELESAFRFYKYNTADKPVVDKLNRLLTEVYGYNKITTPDGAPIMRPRTLNDIPQLLKTAEQKEITDTLGTTKLRKDKDFLNSLMSYRQDLDAQLEKTYQGMSAVEQMVELGVKVPTAMAWKVVTGLPRTMFTLFAPLQGIQRSVYRSSMFLRENASIASSVQLRGIARKTSQEIKGRFNKAFKPETIMESAIKTIENTKLNHPESVRIKDEFMADYEIFLKEGTAIRFHAIGEEGVLGDQLNKYKLEGLEKEKAKATTPEEKARIDKEIRGVKTKEWTNKFNQMTDFLGYANWMADVGAKFGTYTTANKLFDDVMASKNWEPKDPKASIQKAEEYYKELGLHTLDVGDKVNILNMIADGNISGARRLYAHASTERAVPSFTSDNTPRYQRILSKRDENQLMNIAKTFAQAGMRGYSFAVKDLPNTTSILKAMSQKNFKPLVIAVLVEVIHSRLKSLYDKYKKDEQDPSAVKEFGDNKIIKNLMNMGINRFSARPGVLANLPGSSFLPEDWQSRTTFLDGFMKMMSSAVELMATPEMQESADKMAVLLRLKDESAKSKDYWSDKEINKKIVNFQNKFPAGIELIALSDLISGNPDSAMDRITQEYSTVSDFFKYIVGDDSVLKDYEKMFKEMPADINEKPAQTTNTNNKRNTIKRNASGNSNRNLERKPR